MYEVLPGYHQQPTLADRAGTAVAGAVRFVSRRWRFLVTYQAVCFVMLLGYLYSVGGQLDTLPARQVGDSNGLTKRSWGGFDERPMDEKCYRQERTAMILNLFLGCLGLDQWYAHHWVLATFKLITGGMFGLWALIDQILWMVGGVYGTPGCPGGHGDWRY